MKKVLAIVAAAALLVLAQAPAQAGMTGPSTIPAASPAAGEMVHQVGGLRHRRIAAGLAIGLGVIGALAASRAYAERGHYDRYEPSYGRRCYSWSRRCDRGDDRACWKFERRC